MNSEEYRAGLFKKQSQKGTKYCTGTLKIGDKTYYLTLFNNNKTRDNQPDFNLIVRPKQDKKEEVKENPLDDQVFADFGSLIDDEDVPF